MSSQVADWSHGLLYEQSLTNEEKSLRECVAREYMYDRNLLKACLRMNMNSSLASDYAQKFREDPYFNWYVRHLEQSPLYMDQNTKQMTELEQRQKVITMLEKEASYYGPGSSGTSRVQALKMLATLMNMIDKGEGKKEAAEVPGVLIVPDTTDDVTNWEAAAAAQQEQIMKESS